MQGEVFAAALGEGAVYESVDEGEILLPDLARQMMRRLVEPTRARARLFGSKGDTIAESHVLRGPGDRVQVLELPAPDARGAMIRTADSIYDWIVDKLPRRKHYPVYLESASPRAEDYTEVARALVGETGSAIRSDPVSGGLVLSVAIPVQRYKKVLGAVLLSTSSGEIEEAVRTVRLELLRIFSVALLVTVLLSFYLAGTIARPVRRLAAAAERARGRGARVEIPDFTRRGDEIGDLSGSLREMTDALWQRISAIESFAADVAHEIKNPLGSLRSAVETVVRIEDPAKQRRLMAIILDDVERLDRLITDISDASRLDAELGRLELAPIDIAAMLEALVDLHESTRESGTPRLVIELADGGRELVVPGIETSLRRRFFATSSPTPSPSPGRMARSDSARGTTAGRFSLPSKMKDPASLRTSLRRYSTGFIPNGLRARSSALIPASDCRSPSRSSRRIAAGSGPRIAETRAAVCGARFHPPAGEHMTALTQHPSRTARLRSCRRPLYSGDDDRRWSGKCRGPANAMRGARVPRVTGMSGAGRSTLLKILEDTGYEASTTCRLARPGTDRERRGGCAGNRGRRRRPHPRFRDREHARNPGHPRPRERPAAQDAVCRL
jgi:two-component system sensor histidine kinase ChvG